MLHSFGHSIFVLNAFTFIGFYENWLVCIAKYDEVEGLMFDGSYFSLLNPVWIPIPGRYPDNRGPHTSHGEAVWL